MVEVTSGLHLAVTTAVIAGISWLMILQGMEKKLIVRRPTPWIYDPSRFWALLVALTERARSDISRRMQ